MKTLSQFVDINGISRDMEGLRHELDWLLGARDDEHERERDDDLAHARAVIAALQRTVETLGADVLRLAGELEEANRLIHRAAKDVPRLIQPSKFDLDCYAYESRYGISPEGKHMFESDGKKRCAVEDCGLGISAGCHTLPQPPPARVAAPQPEPVKAHAYRQSLVAGKCACGHPDGPPNHPPIVPENSGTTCTACKGFAGFDSHGNPTMLHKPENACGLCDGNGWTK